MGGAPGAKCEAAPSRAGSTGGGDNTGDGPPEDTTLLCALSSEHGQPCARKTDRDGVGAAQEGWRS